LAAEFLGYLVHRLPLPLAQLYRRAHNAKTPLERHNAAFYLWEAALKLLGSVAVVECLAGVGPDAAIREQLAHPITHGVVLLAAFRTRIPSLLK
jgi:hypothetical protein